MNKRSFLLILAAGGAVFALPGCDTIPSAATAPWLAPGATETDPRLRALSWALLAPNPHNLQGWIADVREPGMIHLSVDMRRLLPASDPPNRQVLIGCGAFLELLCQAAAQIGQRADVTLLPDGDYAASGVDARPFASVRLTADQNAQADPLFAAAPLRRTNRAPYSERVPDARVLAQLASAAQRPGITLHGTNEADKVQRLRELAIAGYRVEFTNAATWAENADLWRVGASAVAADPSGIAVTGTVPWLARQLGLLDPETRRKSDGVAARSAISRSVDGAANTHAWIWLASADNTRRTQIEAGRAYMRTDLVATQLGLALHPNSQVLQEFDAMATLYEQFHVEVGVAQPARVQMFVRLGYAERPDPAPRRHLAELIRG